MSSDDELAQWAALFMSSYTGSEAAPVAAVNLESIEYAGLTQSAMDLLRSVDAGGVPAFVTANLLQIAAENGIDATRQQTPNEIIELIRAQRKTGD